MTLEFTEGQDFSARYSLLHQIASSDSTETWLALDKEGDDRVCLKIFSGRADMLNTTESAINTSRGLIHANIVRNYECGEENGNLYISSAYVKAAAAFNPDGKSLSQSWSVLEQLFSALGFAHSLNISHGHLHPGNLLIDDQGMLHVTGFSLPASLSGSNPAYLTSEVQEGQSADVSDDVYSLGCIIFQLLTGRFWSPGSTFEANSPIPADVQQAAAGMLSPTPYDRPTDLDDTLQILSNYARGISSAQPIEIEQTRFNRANAPQTTGATSTPTHQLPRERNQVSSRLVLISLAVLLVLAGFVFFILPDTQGIRDVPLETTAPAPSPLTPAPHEAQVESREVVAGPLELAQLEFLQEEGMRIASELVRKQVELEDLGVLLWAGEKYLEISQQADAGDSFYREEKFRQAMQNYESTIQQLEELKETVPVVMQENIATGRIALEAGEVIRAVTAWSIAHAIEPDNADIEAQLHRAENLDQVLTLVKTADFHESELSLSDALKSYQEAKKLDPKWPPASAGVTRIRLKIAEMKFTDAMSAGFTSLASKEYEKARTAFARAQEIFPKSEEPADGLLQIHLAERMDAIDAYRSSVAELVLNEDWSDAIAEYEAVLDLDPTLVFASDGLVDARERLELEAILDRFLAQPTLMQDDSEFTSAKKALVNASRFDTPGPHLKQQLSTLSRLITVARIPISIELTSDQKTDVTIYKIGNFGRITRTEVQLYPGDYTIVGTRKGYRDVRRQLILLAGESNNPIYISCVEKI